MEEKGIRMRASLEELQLLMQWRLPRGFSEYAEPDGGEGDPPESSAGGTTTIDAVKTSFAETSVI